MYSYARKEKRQLTALFVSVREDLFIFPSSISLSIESELPFLVPRKPPRPCPRRHPPRRLGAPASFAAVAVVALEVVTVFSGRTRPGAHRCQTLAAVGSLRPRFPFNALDFRGLHRLFLRNGRRAEVPGALKPGGGDRVGAVNASAAPPFSTTTDARSCAVVPGDFVGVVDRELERGLPGG